MSTLPISISNSNSITCIRAENTVVVHTLSSRMASFIPFYAKLPMTLRKVSYQLLDASWSVITFPYNCVRWIASKISTFVCWLLGIKNANKKSSYCLAKTSNFIAPLGNSDQKILKIYEEFKLKLLDPEYLKRHEFSAFSASQIQKLNESKPETNPQGVCFGAVLCLAKTLLLSSASSEDKLVELVKPYKDGFTEEAGALNELQGVDILELPLIEDQKKQLKQLEWGETLISCFICFIKTINILWKANAILRSCGSEKLKRYQIVASLIGLKIEKNKDLIDLNPYAKNTHEKLKTLPIGVYGFHMGELERGAGHVILYYKTSFGSYIMDPNMGLYRCSNGREGQAIQALFTGYAKKWACPTLNISPLSLNK